MRRPAPSPAQAIVALAVLAVLLLTSLPAATAHGTDEASRTRAQRFRWRMFGLINDMRTRHDLPRLQQNARLSPEAWQHSREMGRRYRLFHTPNLASLVSRYGATRWGENVGYAQTLRRVLDLMMHSPSHREHLVDPKLDRIGIGVIKLRGWLWITLDLHN
jgi:uncharacterized protein YkwD